MKETITASKNGNEEIAITLDRQQNTISKEPSYRVTTNALCFAVFICFAIITSILLFYGHFITWECKCRNDGMSTIDIQNNPWVMVVLYTVFSLFVFGTLIVCRKCRDSKMRHDMELFKEELGDKHFMVEKVINIFRQQKMTDNVMRMEITIKDGKTINNESCNTLPPHTPIFNNSYHLDQSADLSSSN